MSGIVEIDEADIDPMLLKKANESNETDETDPIDECNLDFHYWCQLLSEAISFVPFFLVLKEISERAKWLSEMEALGQAKKYKDIMMNQIAERMRLIKKIEKDRALKEEEVQSNWREIKFHFEKIKKKKKNCRVLPTNHAQLYTVKSV